MRHIVICVNANIQNNVLQGDEQIFREKSLLFQLKQINASQHQKGFCRKPNLLDQGKSLYGHL